MEGLGRLFNVIPIAAGRGISMKGATAITFVTTASDTFTLTTATSFAGSYTAGIATLVGVTNVYKSAATNGSAVWAKDNTLISTNTVVSGGAITTCFTINAASLPDLACYVKLSVGGSGLVTAILHDLTYQKAPLNLAIPSA
jgi:hypothetical protein